MGSDAPWIEFDETPNKPYDGNYVSMNRDGLITINRRMHEAMQRPAAVILLFDPVNSRIGLKPASPLTPNAFPVKAKGRHGVHRISARSFARKWNLTLDCTVRFPSTEFDNDTLIINLKSREKVTAPTRKRS